MLRAYPRHTIPEHHCQITFSRVPALALTRVSNISDRDALCPMSRSLTAWMSHNHSSLDFLLLCLAPFLHPCSGGHCPPHPLPVSSWFGLQVTHVTSPHFIFSSPPDHSFNRFSYSNYYHVQGTVLGYQKSAKGYKMTDSLSLVVRCFQRK